jgi:hypothetical protein
MGRSSTSGLFKGSSSSSGRCKDTAAGAGCKHTAADDCGDGCSGSSGGGLFTGLRVRMGVVTGFVQWDSSSSSVPPSSSGAATNSLAAIMNSSLYKLALGE